MARNTKNEIVSFRVPAEVKEQINRVADEIPRGSVSKVLSEVFIPAFDRYIKKRERKAQVAA